MRLAQLIKMLFIWEFDMFDTLNAEFRKAAWDSCLTVLGTGAYDDAIDFYMGYPFRKM